MSEIPLTGGWVTAGIVRVGDTVRRPQTERSAFVRELLRLLEGVGFEAAPRYLGIDDDGRDVLSFVEGDVPSDVSGIAWLDPQLRASAELLRTFHDATEGSALAGAEEVVCHGDFGPWNLVWRSGLPVAIIDFDDARPGTRREDVGYALWKHLGLGALRLDGSRQGARLEVFLDAYGETIRDPVGAIVEAQEWLQRKLAAGLDAVAKIEHEKAWVLEHLA